MEFLLSDISFEYQTLKAQDVTECCSKSDLLNYEDLIESFSLYEVDNFKNVTEMMQKIYQNYNFLFQKFNVRSAFLLQEVRSSENELLSIVDLWLDLCEYID